MKTFRKRIIILIAVTLGSIAILSAMVLVLGKDIKERVDKITKNKSALLVRDLRIATLRNLSGQVDSVEKGFEVLAGILPEKDILINFPDAVRDMAIQTSVNHNFAFGTEQDSTQETSGTINFSLSLSGEFKNVVNFMKLFEDHPYVMSLGDIDLRRVNNPADEREIFSLSTTGIIYTK